MAVLAQPAELLKSDGSDHFLFVPEVFQRYLKQVCLQCSVCCDRQHSLPRLLAVFLSASEA